VTWDFFEETGDWNNQIDCLGSKSLFQSEGWAAHKTKFGWQALRFVCTSENKIVTAIQVLIKKKGPITIAWAPGGPVGDSSKIQVGFLKILKSKISEPFYLRIKPQIEGPVVFQNFKPARVSMSAPWTMYLDLSPDTELLHKSLSQNWRHNLKRAKKVELVTKVERLTPEEIRNLIAKTEEIKSLGTQYTLEDIESLLSEFEIVSATAREKSGDLIALRSAIILKNQAWDIFAATSHAGRKCYASNLVTWNLFLECKNRGIVNYDLMGADPQNNPGVFSFKKGTGARLVEFPGEFECTSFKPISWALNFYLKGKTL
jgi:lipid II:glycine glycyltransferase (peptidoglycan interpeptide bridge formation enzyme)